MTTANQAFVLLDRDGVINEDSDAFIKSPDEWLPIDGSLEAIALLNNHGYQVAVITNQSGVARGLFDLAILEQIHAKMHRLVAGHGGKITAVYFCPHGTDSTCNCRKPKPGLLLQCAADYQIDLSETMMIGDSYRDLQAGIAAGAKPVLVKTGNGKKTLTEHPNLNIPVFDSLYDAASYLTRTAP
ncbi:MAG: D-glycero-beta-D-manno-heptose 1,7-bisphosphate 7-phosphatase [Methylovulum miyakonense]|uniref:D-glycero-beta-D-manno-heptose 1,7-bisphosphate 7-phosphatase n=1 Tax=Methylovulum miyakonense TaxID=645578 RepID=UPI003BB6451A